MWIFHSLIPWPSDRPLALLSPLLLLPHWNFNAFYKKAPTPGFETEGDDVSTTATPTIQGITLELMFLGLMMYKK